MSASRIRAVALKELRQVARDPLTLAMLLGVPTMMLLMYGYALNFDVRHVTLAVQDRDRSAFSRELVASFVNSTYFDLVGELPAGTDPETLTQRRRARAILVVPERTAARLERGAAGHVQLIVDGADANTATALLGYAEAIVAARNAAAARARLPNVAALDSTALDYRPRVLFNPELKSTQFLVPGLIGFILMLTAVLSTALSVVREKERGTMEQLRVTSLRPAELIVGKTFPYLGISLAATLLILIAARVLFGVEIRGPYLDLFVATLVYLVGALGYGLVISSLADTQAFAFQVGAVSSILPAILLSGFIFPIESMPPVLQAITYAVPARYFNVILRGVILKGVGLGPYLRDLGFLILYAVVVLGIAYARLRRREG